MAPARSDLPADPDPSAGTVPIAGPGPSPSPGSSVSPGPSTSPGSNDNPNSWAASGPNDATGSSAAARPIAVSIVREAREGDVPALLEMFAELAEYEDLVHELRATEKQLSEALFGPNPVAQALVAEETQSGEVVGYALYFPTFSSFLASHGVWLEDLFVRPVHRRSGVGRALLAAVAANLREAGGERLEWAALDWNEPALRFYRGLGSRTMPEWITHRLIGEDLDRLAGEHRGRLAGKPPSR
ncbi:MAG TPA: GNAT family N-acetyltransferase [Solirubrobacteraceae bacterium]|jgi:GNAT superfamily N-acetyltransferase|nr:GNAT family N-acetyltransferase [Solirubrobacteraceae bacterium]